MILIQGDDEVIIILYLKTFQYFASAHYKDEREKKKYLIWRIPKLKISLTRNTICNIHKSIPSHMIIIVLSHTEYKININPRRIIGKVLYLTGLNLYIWI